ncbi:MAG: histidine kinase [Lachnospiraceae bacterium]|nr:histidine kinase [Lachnospiraceae bacterium]
MGVFQDINIQTLFALNLALILQLIYVSQAVLADPYISRDNRHRLYVIVGIMSFLLIEPQIREQYGEILYRSNLFFWNTFFAAVSYSMRPLILYLFIRISGIDRGLKVMHVILVGNALMQLTAFFKPWVFYFPDGIHWRRGPLGFISFVISLVMILWLVAGSIAKYKDRARNEYMMPVIISVLVSLSVYLDTELGFEPRVSFLTVAMIESIVFYYIWLHLQFVREHENALKAEQRIRIMMSQIQPHFLFNTLSTIQALTETDPEKASEVIEEFALYLRQNINSLEQEDMIPVRKEIEHTRIYSHIEEVRFPSIRIEYEIEDDDFMVPSLTVQPMVENAIRHGVRGKKHGWISVSTYREKDRHVIAIRDNGKGFDVERMMEDTKNGDHIGVKNVRDRIVDMAGGTFRIESVPGEGTSITISIPVQEKAEEA